MSTMISHFQEDSVISTNSCENHDHSFWKIEVTEQNCLWGMMNSMVTYAQKFLKILFSTWEWWSVISVIDWQNPNDSKMTNERHDNIGNTSISYLFTWKDMSLGSTAQVKQESWVNLLPFSTLSVHSVLVRYIDMKGTPNIWQ